jgi:hypothetical protein
VLLFAGGVLFEDVFEVSLSETFVFELFGLLVLLLFNGVDGVLLFDLELSDDESFVFLCI